jgi:small subunit ribosomal protein S17
MTEELNPTGDSATATTEAAPTTENATATKSNRLVLQGKVVSDKMEKTIVVEVEYLKKHRLYKKAIRRHNRFKAHDEENTSHVGDIVRIEECRPYSKEKTWRLVEIVKKGVVL